MPERDIERFARDVLHREERGAAFEAGVDHGNDPRVRDAGVDQTPEDGREACDVLGHQLELERFDGNETIVLRLVRAENRSKNAASNLVQHAIRAEG